MQACPYVLMSVTYVWYVLYRIGLPSNTATYTPLSLFVRIELLFFFVFFFVAVFFNKHVSLRIRLLMYKL